jgi:lipopolysaccharide transport system ATP-binding protein
MYVRLAFAVAAHLDPEILIIDEVLAVGDASFQRKCIGKMKEVSSKSGKTILFVSHNMEALRNLCDRAIVLNHGKITDMGNPETVIASYLRSETTQYLRQEFEDPSTAPGNDFIRIRQVKLEPSYINESSIIDVRTPLSLSFECWYNLDKSSDVMVAVQLFGAGGECVFELNSPKKQFEKGKIFGNCQIPGYFLNDGSYSISLSFMKSSIDRLFLYESCLSFDVEDYRENTDWYGKWNGSVRPAFPLSLNGTEST